MFFQTIKTTTTNLTNGKPSKAKQLQKAATNALESVQKHFSKEQPKIVATRAQNGILKNIEKKEKVTTRSSTGTTKSRPNSDVSEPSLYVSALENR